MTSRYTSTDRDFLRAMHVQPPDEADSLAVERLAHRATAFEVQRLREQRNMAIICAVAAVAGSLLVVGSMWRPVVSIEFPIVDRLIDDLREYAAVYDAQEELILSAFRLAAETVRADERERCAKVAVEWAHSYDAATEIPARIRSGQ